MVASLAVACTDDDSSAEDGAETTAGSGMGDGAMTTAGNTMTGQVTGDGSGTVGDDVASSTGAPTDDTSTGGDTSAGTDGGSTTAAQEESDSGTTMAAEDTVQELCEAPGDLVSCDSPGDNPTIFNAIGLNCPGDANTAIPIYGEGFNYSDPLTWAIASQLGTFIEPATGLPLWGPHEGQQFLVLSSGNVGTPNAAGLLPASQDQSTGNPDNKPLPAPMSAAPGSGGAPFVGCDGVNDCSDSLQGQWVAGGGAANDLIWFQFGTDVPGGTHGFVIDFAYFSREFPEWVGTVFNDMFVVWSNSETYTGNLCFVDDQPCTVTALWPTQYQNADPELDQTGFSFDGGTGWFQIKGSAEPLESLQLTFAVFDMGDTILETYVILDNFAWDCEGCTPSEVNPCGVVPK